MPLVHGVFTARLSLVMLGLCLGVMVGCAKQDIPPPLHTQSDAAGRARRAGVTYKSLYDFTGESGARPNAGLTVGPKGAASGVLYGTTPRGGENGDGVVFAVSTSGRHRVLYSFGGKPDGEEPDAGLIKVNGKLYGTTYAGGGGSECENFDGEDIGCGTVFEVSPSGTERVLYRFKGDTDGAHPLAALVAVNGAFYGTTSGGGGSGCKAGAAVGCGTVFEVSASGTERVLYRFKGGSDGSYPKAGLTAIGNALYGTTLAGGNQSCDFLHPGCGTVFDVVSGEYHLLHAFKGGADGARPSGGFVALNGVLYGMTGFGDDNNHGTVFEISPSGKERVLYRFQGSPDGAGPRASLSVRNGLLYGTTESGGNGDSGTVFEVSTSGKERILYSFEGPPDGQHPRGSLVSVKDILYGMTPFGGKSSFCPHGCGIVFKLSP